MSSKRSGRTGKSHYVYDPIHKSICVSDTAMSIINTPEFQRLHRIKQTGACSMVFVGAEHSRLGHSIGVYHLAKQMMREFQVRQPELGITDRQVELVGIAGLVHDLGHGFLSHFFDFLLSELKRRRGVVVSPSGAHEVRSCRLFRHMVDKHAVALTPAEVDQVCDMVAPPEDLRRHYMYSIVANLNNEIDVDKFDYLARDARAVGLVIGFDSSRIMQLARVIDDEICYPPQVASDIAQMFYTRYRLHKDVYTNKRILCVESMICDALMDINDDPRSGYDFAAVVNDLDGFCALTDHALTHIIETHRPDVWNRIQCRDLYSYVGELVFPRSCPRADASLAAMTEQLSSMGCVKGRDYEFRTSTVGYVGKGKSNPLRRVSFFRVRDDAEATPQAEGCPDDRVSGWAASPSCSPPWYGPLSCVEDSAVQYEVFTGGSSQFGHLLFGEYQETSVKIVCKEPSQLSTITTVYRQHERERTDNGGVDGESACA